MAYNKTTWKSGDIVTSEKLNKMENGIADVCNGLPFPFIATTSTLIGSQRTLTITPNDILDADEKLLAIPILVNFVGADFEDDHSRSNYIFIGVSAALTANGSYKLKVIGCGTSDYTHVDIYYANTKDDYFSMYEN